MGDKGGVYEFYRSIIRFRQKGPYRNCLIYGRIEPVLSSENVIAYKRYTQGETLLCWFNFSGGKEVEMLPDGGMEPVWQSYGEVCFHENVLELQPYQSVMLKHV